MAHQACVLKQSASRIMVVSDAGATAVDLPKPKPALLVAQRLVGDSVVALSADLELLLVGLDGALLHTVPVLFPQTSAPASLMACELGVFLGLQDRTLRYELDAETGLRFQCAIPREPPGVFFDDRKHQVRTLAWLRLKLMLEPDTSVDTVLCSWPLLVCRLDGALAVYDRASKKLTRFPDVRTPDVGLTGRTVCWSQEGCLTTVAL
jgi:hypothetical protein